MRAITSLVVALSWILSATAWAAPPLPKYTLTEIPSLGANIETMVATALNARGEVVGFATPFGFNPIVAFFYQSSTGAVNQLTFGPEQSGYASGINDQGVIAGFSFGPDFLPEAVLWSSSGGAQTLGPDTIAMAVNNNRTVVGSFDCNPVGCAAVWSGPNHVFTSLAFLPNPGFCEELTSNALAINNKGYIVGRADSCAGGGGTGGAVEWRDGRITLLAPDVANGFNLSLNVANGLNDIDDVVGVSGDHAFLYHQGHLSDLGTLPGDVSSSANGINNLGEIVGVSQDLDGNSRAFIYVNGQMHDLNSLIPLGSVKLEEAVGINSLGWIAANGTRAGQQHAYLLTRVQ